MKTVCIIPARGGSKGIPKKNLQQIAGHPLIAHSIMHAINAKKVDCVHVSTDDPEIAAISRKYGAEVIIRPKEISGDDATSESALIHALKTIENSGQVLDLVIFLQCTSPIRGENDIDLAIKQLMDDNADSLLSVSPNHRFIWEKSSNTLLSINYDYTKRMRRQEMYPQYIENGSIYIFKPWVLKKYKNRLGGIISAYCMSEESCFEIDSQLDFNIVNFLMSKGIPHDSR